MSSSTVLDEWDYSPKDLGILCLELLRSTGNGGRQRALGESDGCGVGPCRGESEEKSDFVEAYKEA